MKMFTYILVSILAGGVMLFLEEGSKTIPFARRWFASFSLLRRQENFRARRTIVEIAFGFVFVGFYILFYRALPLQPGLPRTFFFTLIFWIPTSVYKATSDWASFDVPADIHLYAVFVGLIKLLAVSLLFHFTLAPAGLQSVS